VHTRIPFDLVTADGIATFRRFIERAAGLVVSYGGSFSGEHGDGQSRGELLPKMFGEELVQAFGQFKAIFDPGNLMNPGKVVAPYRIDENLRLGASWSPRDYDSFFAYPDDDGRFERRHALRGRRQVPARDGGGEVGGGVMCPSYMSPGKRSTPPGAGAGCCSRCWRPRRLPGHGGLAVHRGPRRARPVPGLQGLQEGLPGRGGHGHHEGRVPGPPLRRAAAPAGALLDGWLPVAAQLASRAPRLVNALTQHRSCATC